VRTNIINSANTYQWIQVVTTNAPRDGSQPASANTLPPFVDNGLRGQGPIPFHPGMDERSFFDIPGRPNFSTNITWSAETALVRRQPDTMIINVYPTEFWWGWTTRTRPAVVERGRITGITGFIIPDRIEGTILGQGGESTNMTARLRVHRGGPQATGSVAFIDTTTNKFFGVAPINVFLTAASGNVRVAYDAVRGGATQVHSILFVYSGDEYYAGNATGPFTLTVTRPPGLPGARLDSSSNPEVVGTPVTFTATMSPAFAGWDTPTGTVTFLNGATTLGTIGLSSGVASISVTNLTPGTQDITAIYSGDNEYTSCISSLVEIVNDSAGQHPSQGNSSTSVSSSNADIDPGQTVTLSASVAAVSPATGVPSGTVTFYDGNTEIGTQSLDASGNASINVNNLAVGAHNITVIYSGDASFIGSGGSLHQIVNKWNSTTTLSVSTGSSVFGQSVAFAASISGSQGSIIPTGAVYFYQGSVPLGTASVDASGHAAFSVSDLPVGVNSVTATY
jgi:hypothetical protein